jgi:DNA-binding NtrC family response regulator
MLQERSFTRVGGTRTISCDVRVMAATNRDLKKLIEAGKFRDDLYYRLNVFPIELPPLRKRREDIEHLAAHFAKTASASIGVEERRVSPEAATLLRAYDWPGNIRELANVIERAVLMSDSPNLMPAHFPAEIIAAPAPILNGEPAGDLRANERAMIVSALRDNNWNQTRAARALGISRDNLRYRLKKYGIKKNQ